MHLDKWLALQMEEKNPSGDGTHWGHFKVTSCFRLGTGAEAQRCNLMFNRGLT
jgi:hypothetical protein